MISRLYLLCAGLTLILATLFAYLMAIATRSRSKARTSPPSRTVAFSWSGWGFMGFGPYVSVFRLGLGESVDSIPFASRLGIGPGMAIRIARAPELDSIPLRATTKTSTYTLDYLIQCDVDLLPHDPIRELCADDREVIADTARRVEREIFDPFIPGSFIVTGEWQESPESGSFPSPARS